jgi:hypothetical protein
VLATPVEGFAAFRAELVPFPLDANAFLPPRREIRAKLGDIVRAGTPESERPCAAQAHPQPALHERHRQAMHAEATVTAEASMSAMLPAGRSAGGNGEQHEQRRDARN